MKKTSIMKAYHMKRSLLVLAVLACIGSIASAQTYRPLTGTRVVLSTSYPSGNALTLQANPTSAYTLTLPAASPTAGDILRSDPTSANTLIWTSPLDMYVFENGLTEVGSNTVKWGGNLTGATVINTNGSNALSFVNNDGSASATMTIGGGTGTLTLDVRGGTTINTSGTANTSIGNSTGTLTLTSAGLNVTSDGIISDANSSVVIADDVEPSVHDNFTLGTNAARWADVFVGPSTVHIGTTTTGGDELALSYNTTSNKAIFNVGSVDAMELTSLALTLTANLVANGDVTLGNDADAVSVNSTNGLTINSGNTANLSIGESAITRADVLTLTGAELATPANTTTISIDKNMTATSSAGGITLTASTDMKTRGTTNNMDAYASASEFAEVDLTSTVAIIKAEAGANDAILTVMNSLGSGLISASSPILNLESSAINIGDASSDIVTVTGTIAEQYPLYFEGSTADGFQTRFEITDPNADRTITFPDVDGTVITTGNTNDLSSLTWLVGGNTITGGTTTRKIGIAAQASNDDGLAIMTDGVDRLTITAAGASTFSGSLTSTGAFAADDAVTLGNGGDNISINAGTGTFEVASSGVDISTAGAVSAVTTLSMSGTLTNSAVSNQLVLGTTNTTTISATAPAASRTYTIPDVLANASFVMTEGAQTIAGAKTFSSGLAVTSNTASTSTTTGALVVTGGTGIGGEAYVGGALDVAGATTLDGNVTLGDGTADAITVNSTSGLTVNTGNQTDLTIDETLIARANSLTIRGAESGAPANTTTLTIDKNLTATSSAGGITLTANTDMKSRGVTNNMDAYASGSEFAEVDLTTTVATIKAEAGATDAILSVMNSVGTAIISASSTDLNLESSNIYIGDATSDVVTITATVADQYPLYFEGATADGNETRFEITDPTASNTITFPDVSGTVLTTGNLGDNVWQVGGNTITGTSTTRKVGIAAQGSNDDGLAIMTDGVDRLTITAAGDATFSGALTSTGTFTANGNATLGDGGDNVSINAGTGTFELASTGVDISTAGAISSVTTLSMSGALTNTLVSNQLILGTTQTTTINAAAPAASRVYTIPDVLADASFVMTAGTQSIAGAKTFSGDLTLSGVIQGGTPLVFEGATADNFETSFAITDPTADNTITFPDVTGTVITTGNLSSITGFVPYNTTSATNTADANGTAYLFNVQYDGAATGNALGARISSDAAGGTNATATGLTLAAVGTGTGTATGLTVSASGGTTNKAINVTAGGIDVDAGGVNVDAGGVTIAAGGLTVTAGLTTFGQGMKVPITVAAAAATYTADDDDYIIVQTAVQGVTFPTGADGRVIIVKNTSGSDITLTRGSTDTFEGAATTLTLTTGTSQTFVFSNGVWYLIGN
jgi:hypothetical protein